MNKDYSYSTVVVVVKKVQ